MKWIKCSERLPEFGYYFVKAINPINGFKSSGAANYIKDAWAFDYGYEIIEWLDESNQEGSLKDSDWKENNNIINASIASCAFKHPELYTGTLCMKCYKSWPLLKECPLDKPDVKEDNTQHKSIQCLDDTIKEVKNLWKGPNKLIAEAVTHLNWAKEKIIKYLNEENVIAPLLQNELKGDDLVAEASKNEGAAEATLRSTVETQIGQKKALVISGFPGIGKSYFQKNSPLTVLDSDSSTFSWKEKGVRNENFPDNYIQHIKGNLNYVDIILVSSHKEVRTALYQAGIDFLLVYPKKALKDEYIGRFKARGNDDAFISFVDKNWEAFIDDIQTHPKEMTVRLGTGQYLSDYFLLPNRITEPQKEVSQEKPDSSTDDGQQNKTSNSEATILSAKQMVEKHFSKKCVFEFGGDMHFGDETLNANEIVAAILEYHNQFK